MDEQAFNTSVRALLKKVGITSQRALEQAAHDAIANGRLSGNEAIAVQVRLESELLEQPLVIDGTVNLS